MYTYVHMILYVTELRNQIFKDENKEETKPSHTFC